MSLTLWSTSPPRFEGEGQRRQPWPQWSYFAAKHASLHGEKRKVSRQLVLRCEGGTAFGRPLGKMLIRGYPRFTSSAPCLFTSKEASKQLGHYACSAKYVTNTLFLLLVLGPPGYTLYRVWRGVKTTGIDPVHGVHDKYIISNTEFTTWEVWWVLIRHEH